MTRPRLRAPALLCCTAILAISHAAAAKPKLALTQIDGDASGDVRDAVAEALEGGKELSLIGAKEVNRAVDKLGDVADLTDKDFKKLSSELEADAVVVGKLEKSGGAKSLKFRIYAHKKMAKGFTVNFKDPKSEKFHTLLHDKILDKIGVAAGSGGDDDEVADKPAKGKKGKKVAATGEDDEDPIAAKADKKGKKGKKPAKGDDDDAPQKAAKGDDDDAKPGKKTKADKADKGDDDTDTKPRKLGKTEKTPVDDDAKPPAGDDDKPKDGDDDGARKPKKKVATEDGGEDGSAEVSVKATPAAAARSASTASVRFDLGISVLQHSYTFNAAPMATAGPKNTSLSPVPGVRLGGEIYPFALSGSEGALANLGIGGDLDRTISLKLTSTANGMAQQTTVKQQNYSIGARYRLVFGADPATASTLTIGLGYGKRLFSPDKSQIMDATLRAAITRDTPTTEYTYVDPGATFRLPVTPKIALFLGARGLVITNGGPIQATTSYGQAKVYGVEADLGLDVLVGSRFVLRFSGDVDQIGFTFQGKGALSKSADGTQIVGGLADRGLGGAATLGVLY